MLLAHKIELRPTLEQSEYLRRACGSRRHCYNQLLAHFKQDGVKWSKTAAYQHYIKVIRPAYPWYNEVSSRVTRNAIDDLDNAFKHFFHRVKLGQKPGFQTFKKKGFGDSFAMREKPKFDIVGRTLRIEKLKTRIKMRQKLRFTGTLNQVTISMRAGKFYASILVETEDYNPHAPKVESVGVDFGIRRFVPTTKPCSQCGQLHDMPLGKDVMECDCGNTMDRDLNAAINIDFLGRAALLRDPKRTQESGKAAASVDALAVTA